MMTLTKATMCFEIKKNNHYIQYYFIFLLMKSNNSILIVVYLNISRSIHAFANDIQSMCSVDLANTGFRMLGL